MNHQQVKPRNATAADVAELRAQIAAPLRAMAAKPSAREAAEDSDAERVSRMLWYALVALNVARPAGADHQQIAAVLATVERGIGAEEVKAVSDILQELGLANTTLDRAGRPHTVITAAGVEVVEYRRKAPKGIGRPR